MRVMKRAGARTLQRIAPGPLADALADLDPLQHDIIVGLLTGDDPHDDALAALHGTTEEEVRRQRHAARAKLAGALKASA